MSSSYVVAAAQIHVAFADVNANLAKVGAVLAETSRQGAALTVFPECALTGYCFSSLAEAQTVAQPVPGPATEALTSLCRQYDQACVVGLLEKDGERIFNACVLVGPQGLLGVYRKIHLPYLGVDMFTTPGDRPFAVQQAGAARIGMNICYDAAFPESSRVLALAGADVIALPTNWPPGAECTAACAINARALENHVYYAAVNRVGEERGFRFIGSSKICNPYGKTLAEASADDEQLLYAECDLAVARNKHIVRVPGKHEIRRFADRRPEMYGPIVEPKAEN